MKRWKGIKWLTIIGVLAGGGTGKERLIWSASLKFPVIPPPRALCVMVDTFELPRPVPVPFVVREQERFFMLYEQLLEYVGKYPYTAEDARRTVHKLKEIYALISGSPSLQRAFRYMEYDPYLVTLVQIHSFVEALYTLAGGDFRLFLDHVIPEGAGYLMESRDPDILREALRPPEVLGYVIYHPETGRFEVEKFPWRQYQYWRMYRYELKYAYESGDSRRLKYVLDEIRTFSGGALQLLMTLNRYGKFMLLWRNALNLTPERVLVLRRVVYLTEPFSTDRQDSSLLFFYALDTLHQNLFLQLLQLQMLLTGRDYMRFLCEKLSRGWVPVLNFHTHPADKERIYSYFPAGALDILERVIPRYPEQIEPSLVDRNSVGKMVVPHGILGAVYGKSASDAKEREMVGWEVAVMVLERVAVRIRVPVSPAGGEVMVIRQDPSVIQVEK